MATVLIIEDETNIRMFISANLEARGYDVLEAGTGTTGLELLRKHLPDILVLDVLLPDMEGWDILQTMSGEASLKAIPVILMTASVNVPDPQRMEYPNLVQWLTKPASVEKLVETVQSVVG